LADQLTDNAFPASQVFRQLAFSINASKNFFGDVIKIRSLRLLLERLTQAYGVENGRSFIRMRVNSAETENYQPHGDLVGNSFATIAAVCSSADAITVVPSNQQTDLHIRTARNISLLLKEESKLDKVMDPFAGSYFIESITHSLVEKVWDRVMKES
jgi:methylmalonyl-CoA mutase